jgi:hypothetical protein
MALCQIVFIAVLQCKSLYTLYKRRHVNNTSAHKSIGVSKVGTTMQHATKVATNVELRMMLNTCVIFIAMAFKAVFFVLLLSSNATSINPFQVFLYATDVFSLLSPVVLVFSSKHVRKMLIEFVLHHRKYTI